MRLFTRGLAVTVPPPAHALHSVALWPQVYHRLAQGEGSIWIASCDLYNLENAYKELDDYGQVIADYNKVVELNPETAYVYIRRGSAYQELGDYERAIADYTEAIRLDPDNARAYEGRGWSYRDQGDTNAARADWERAIELYEAQGQPYSAELVRSLLSLLEN